MLIGRNQFSQFDLSSCRFQYGPYHINIVHTKSATTSSFEVNNTLDTSKQP